MREEEKLPPLGKDSLNLVEFALTSTSAKVSTEDSIERVDTILDPETREPVKRRLVIQSPGEIGLPNPTDELILLHMIARAYDQTRFKERRFEYSRYQICKDMGWTTAGKNLERVKLATLRWKATTYIYDKAWWHPEKGWLTRAFSIIDNTNDWDKDPQSWILWNQLVLENFRSGYMKNLDLEYVRRLKFTVSWKLYRYIDKHSNRPRTKSHGSLVFDLHTLAHEKLGIPKGYPLKELKRILYKSIEELSDTGYLKPQSKQATFSKLRPGMWRVKVQRKATRSKPQQQNQPELTGLARELVDRGLTPSTAEKIASQHDSEKVAHKIEVHDWLRDKKDRRLSKNPAGYLVSSILEDYVDPKGFESKTDREARLAKRRASEEQQEREERERLRREEEQAAVRRERVDTYLESLTPEERSRVEEEALGKTSDFQRRLASKDSEMGKKIRQTTIDVYVEALLK